MPRLSAVIIVLGVIVSAPSAGFAKDNTAATRTLDALEACRANTAADVRLACYDKAIDAVAASRRSGELIVLDREKVVERRRAQFGLVAEPDAGLGGEAEVNEVETAIRHAQFVNRTDHWNLELVNGTVWTTLDTLRFTPKDGAKVTLRKGRLGAFRAEIGRETVQVKRLR